MRLRPIGLSLLVVLAAAAPAAAQTTVTDELDAAAASIGRGDAVYVDPGARSELSEADERDLQSRIDEAGGRIYIAVLPEGSGNLARALGERVRRSGTYVVGASGAWSAASDDLAKGAAQRLVEEATSGGGNTADVLQAFVGAVAAAPTGGGQESDGGGSGVLLGILGVLAIGGGALAVRGTRRRRAREAAELEELRGTARDDLLALGDDVRALELDVEMPSADPRAKERYGEAVGSYVRAEEALDLARRPADFAPIGQALEEGRWAMEAAKARLAGGEEPERRPPCFFDPRHGPSVADVEWRPELGEARAVPVCAADAARLADGEEPMSREVTVGGRRMPYWDAPSQYAPFYAGGMFGGYGGFVPGLLFGSMLADAGSSWDGGGGGDFGGGGFGGGDFGGGDFGG